MFVPGVRRDTASSTPCVRTSSQPFAVKERRSSSVDAMPPPTVRFTSRATAHASCKSDGFAISPCPCYSPFMSPHLRAAAVLLVLLAAAARPPAGAQVRPIYDMGAAGLTRILERLQTT